MPETHWDAGANSIKPEFGQHYQELATLKTQHDARLAARPEKPDGYALEFSKDFKPTVPVAFDDKDPRVAPLRAWAHEAGLDQAGFSKLLEIEASRVAAEHSTIAAAHDAEIKKLGANGTARVTALRTFLTGALGNKDAAQAIMDRMVLASDIEALEKLQLAFGSQGAAPIGANGRVNDPPVPPKSPAERMWPNGFGTPQARTS